MNYQDVERAVSRLGLSEVSRTKKAVGYSRLGSTADVYINTETKTEKNTLIIHPRFGCSLHELLDIPGVMRTQEQRFSSNYGHFPIGITPKGKENHFGIPFGFRDTAALEVLLEALELVALEPA
ncbi:DUF2002 family protein [Endozoicomonadaceae bacterium StTr2]